MLLHAGLLNIDLSATCDTTTVTASSGTAICSGPAQGESQAGAGFGDRGAGGYASAMGQYLDYSTFFSASMSIQAEYQITFLGPQGPGFMDVTICGFANDLGSFSACLITPNGSLRLSGFPYNFSCFAPDDIPITFGVPLDVQLSLQSSVGHVSCCGHFGEDGASVELTYQALDARKNPVSATVEVVIPEPSTW
jgi:hypothetical protein